MIPLVSSLWRLLQPCNRWHRRCQLIWCRRCPWSTLSRLTAPWLAFLAILVSIPLSSSSCSTLIISSLVITDLFGQSIWRHAPRRPHRWLCLVLARSPYPYCRLRGSWSFSLIFISQAPTHQRRWQIRISLANRRRRRACRRENGSTNWCQPTRCFWAGVPQ